MFVINCSWQIDSSSWRIDSCFQGPSAVAVATSTDGMQMMFVTDCLNHQVCMISGDSALTILAGYSLLQCVVACWSVLQSVADVVRDRWFELSLHATRHSPFWQDAVCCSVLQFAAVCCSVLQCAAVCCSVLQCVAVCCSVLQCAAVCCSVLQCAAVCCNMLLCAAVCCCVLLCAAVCFGVLHCVAICYSSHNIMLPCVASQWQVCPRINKSCHTFEQVMSHV